MGGGQKRRTDGNDRDASAEAAQSQESAQTRGLKRRGEGDSDEQATQSWRIDGVPVKEGSGMTYEQLCSYIRTEFPDLAEAWADAFPELVKER